MSRRARRAEDFGPSLAERTAQSAADKDLHRSMPIKVVEKRTPEDIWATRGWVTWEDLTAEIPRMSGKTDFFKRLYGGEAVERDLKEEAIERAVAMSGMPREVIFGWDPATGAGGSWTSDRTTWAPGVPDTGAGTVESQRATVEQVRELALQRDKAEDTVRRLRLEVERAHQETGSVMRDLVDLHSWLQNVAPVEDPEIPGLYLCGVCHVTLHNTANTLPVRHRPGCPLTPEEQ